MSSDQYVDVDYELKNQIKLFVGERSKTQFESGCKMFDLFLHNHYQFDLIVFQNFYTGYLTIKAKERYSVDNKNEWKFLIKRLKLMPNVHGETGANDIFSLKKDSFLSKDLKSVSQLRFILQQPSMYWKDFSIDDIRLKILNPEFNFDRVLDEYTKKSDKVKKINFEKLPPVEILSNHLQNLWLLCNEANKQTKSEIEDNPRFDLDGSYDVNLLSINN